MDESFDEKNGRVVGQLGADLVVDGLSGGQLSQRALPQMRRHPID